MDKNTKTLLSVFGLVIVMVGLAFASVPLYSLFCRVTGWGGTTQTAETAPDQVLERQVTVKFNADTSRNFMWDFKPEQRDITVNIGAQALVSYRAENKSKKALTGTAVYNVSPPKVGKYFHKIECFCFQEQTLPAGKAVSMPIVFYVDPSFHEDPYMDDVKVITLSYTFYESETKALDEALEDFYNDDPEE
ncbi:MAG: cytochrome c oxidase assembly protein [Bdellovibrionales bacterium]